MKRRILVVEDDANLADLADRLAGHIPDPAERSAFLDAAGRLA